MLFRSGFAPAGQSGGTPRSLTGPELKAALIASTEVMGEEVMKAKVEEVCASCHEGEDTGFPAAWLSHYPPSLTNAPLVFIITIAYRIFIPFMIIGLTLQIFLHLYRVGIRR